MTRPYGSGELDPSPLVPPSAAQRHVEAFAARVAPFLDRRGALAALALAATSLLAVTLQFATGLFEAFPTLALLMAGLAAAEAVALAALVVLAGRIERGPLIAMGLAGLAFLLACGSAGAKLAWRRGLAGNGSYALSAEPTRFPRDAVDVELRTSDGVTLRATQLGGRRPLGVVILPGWRTNRNGFAIATLATWLANDMDVLLVDPRGQGDSGGTKSPDGSDRLDVAAAVAFMRANGHARVGVLAEQDSAPAAIAAALDRPGPDALALVAPAARWGETLAVGWDPRTLAGRLYWRVAAGIRLSGGRAGDPPLLAIKQLKQVPVLIAGSKGDPGTTVDTLHLAAPEPKSLILFGGEGRPVAWSHFADYYRSVSEWLAYALAGPPGAGGEAVDAEPPAKAPAGEPTPAPAPGP